MPPLGYIITFYLLQTYLIGYYACWSLNFFNRFRKASDNEIKQWNSISNTEKAFARITQTLIILSSILLAPILFIIFSIEVTDQMLLNDAKVKLGITNLESKPIRRLLLVMVTAPMVYIISPTIPITMKVIFIAGDLVEKVEQFFKQLRMKNYTIQSISSLSSKNFSKKPQKTVLDHTEKPKEPKDSEHKNCPQPS